MGLRRLRTSLRLWVRRQGFRRRRKRLWEGRVKVAKRQGDNKRRKRAHLKAVKWRALERQAANKAARRRKQLRAAKPLRERAMDVMDTLVGATESWGSNAGPIVSKIIRANGGAAGEPYCGDTVAYCYRLAGSRAVGRFWASVPMLGAAGFRVRNPKRGDIVRLFGAAHVELFDHWIDRSRGTFKTKGGNTGREGGGPEGIWPKTRSTSQVTDFRRITH